ncbi:MAG: hypothetical protein GX452_09090 [Ignavibacteriales bacterium]|nr:hypothetical protein [Ignavibacteriales bacterium]
MSNYNKIFGMVYLAIFLSFICIFSANGQKEAHQWTPLVVNDNQKVWYDYNQIKHITLPKFEIWLLEVHRSPQKIEGVVSGVMRTKTLYRINLGTMSYGIVAVAYYNINNQELKRFNYEMETYEEKYKYSYPILEKSLVGMLIKEISKKETKQDQ